MAKTRDARPPGAPPALGDLYHLLVDSPWPRLLGIIATLFLIVNALFAFAYLAGGDGIENARPGSFIDAFFFSVQTMGTIGYGRLAPGTVWANLLVTVEVITGVLGLAMVTGLVFAKFSRPTARVVFSQRAVVTPHDGVPSLMFRMANARGNRIVEARVRAVLARDETTAEGETMRRFHDLALVRDRNPLFALTWTAIHPITATSPLFGATPEGLAAMGAEVVASLVGIDETVSQTIHARHTYAAADLAWGARLRDILRRLPDGRRQVDYARFHDVEPTAER
ncbi:MAG: ATP-sensitive inward rectifier potassium channel 10 [Deltaproteobacteria bacterium]|nr:MAG: ATP-sensitive inward rectifier potassium channel 10 [Deltaproteobacteria bacterium]